MVKMNGSKAMAECLKAEGVSDVFGYPGGAIMPFYDVLYDEKSIRHVLVRHEQCAAHAAEGYARASGKTGVCISTSGPGGTNLITGIADAMADSVPMVAISGQVSRPLIGNDAFQEADLFGITMAITKHNFKIMKPNDLQPVFKKAFHIASTGRPGPVHIDVPKDLQVTDVEFDEKLAVDITGYKPTLDPHPLQVKRAADMLLKAERPAILCGGGVVISGASKELLRLAEATNAPVVYTLMGKGAVDDRHELCMGATGMHGKVSANRVLHECDVMLAVGCRFSDRVTGDPKHFAPQAKIIHVDVDPAEIGKNIPVELPIVADAKRTLSAMLENIKANQRKETAWAKRFAQMRSLCHCSFGGDEIPISPGKVIKALNEVLPENAIVTTEVGQHQMWAMHFLESKRERHFISSGGLGTMGFGFPAAIGAKVAKPNQPVVDVAGDGSFLMVCQDLTTCVEFDIPVVVVVLNNNWLGMVRQWQKMFFKKRYSSTHLGKMPDFTKLAKAFGADGIRVTRPSELNEAIENALKAKVPYIVDVATDPEHDILPMVPAGGKEADTVPSYRCEKIHAHERR